MSWVDGPWAGLDLETTSVQAESARIVTASVFIQDDGCWTWLLRPDIPIPPEASAIHGISNEQAQQDGMEPAEGIYQVHRALQNAWAIGAPVVAHNAVYDMTTLDREMRRHLGYPLEIRGPVIDTLCIDRAVDQFRPKKVASHALGDACRHWGVQVNGEVLHSSEGDVSLAVKLAQRILGVGKFADGKVCHAAVVLHGLSLSELWHRQVEWYADQAASTHRYRDDNGLPVDDRNTVWPLKPYIDGKVG